MHAALPPRNVVDLAQGSTGSPPLHRGVDPPAVGAESQRALPPGPRQRRSRPRSDGRRRSAVDEHLSETCTNGPCVPVGRASATDARGSAERRRRRLSAHPRERCFAACARSSTTLSKGYGFTAAPPSGWIWKCTWGGPPCAFPLVPT